MNYAKMNYGIPLNCHFTMNCHLSSNIEIYRYIEHIGRLAIMSVLDTEVDGSNPAAVCCFLEQDTLSALLQSTQL